MQTLTILLRIYKLWYESRRNTPMQNEGGQWVLTVLWLSYSPTRCPNVIHSHSKWLAVLRYMHLFSFLWLCGKVFWFYRFKVFSVNPDEVSLRFKTSEFQRRRFSTKYTSIGLQYSMGLGRNILHHFPKNLYNNNSKPSLYNDYIPIFELNLVRGIHLL